MSATPPSQVAALQEGLAQLGLALGGGAQQRLLDYLGLIARWNLVYNLTAVRDPAAMVTQHLLDSLAVLPALHRWLAGRASAPMGAPLALSPAGGALKHGGVDPADQGIQPTRLLDVGSGAGLPGVVLAIAEPSWSVTCVDAAAKKAAFIRQVGAELSLPRLQGVHARVEDMAPQPAFDVVTSRAFASLADFVARTDHLLTASGCWMAMKGTVPDDEIAALPPHLSVFHVERLTVPGLEAERCLIWIRKTR